MQHSKLLFQAVTAEFSHNLVTNISVLKPHEGAYEHDSLVCRPALLDNLPHLAVVLSLVLAEHAGSF